MPTIFSECMTGICSSTGYFIIFGFIIYITLPILLKIYPKIILEILFLNRICPPVWTLKLNKPDKTYKLRGAKNHYIRSTSGNTLGVWHIPPVTQYDSPGTVSGSLNDAEKVIVYCHGNAFHRGFTHRRDLYEELQKTGFHIVTFDYSGFGDSTGRPSTRNVVEDAIFIYKWTIDQVKKEDALIVLWGHSLGTYISTRALSSLCEEEVRLPEALVLEAPFTNSYEASDGFPLSKILFTLYPFVKTKVHNIIHQIGAELNTEEFLPNIKVPVLILHAQDDTRVDIKLGVKLYEKTTSHPNRKSPYIRFVRIHEDHGVQHYTAQHPDITDIFKNFLGEVLKVKGREPGSGCTCELIDI